MIRDLIDYYKPGGPHHRAVYHSRFGYWFRGIPPTQRALLTGVAFSAVVVPLVTVFALVLP